MERIRALIDKLQQQSEDKGDIAAMKVTVLMLQAELEKLSLVSYTPSPSKISVVLPGGNRAYQPQPAPEPAPKAAEKTIPPPPPPAPMPEPAPKKAEPLPEPVMKQRESPYEPRPAAAPKAESSWQPEPVAAIPATQHREMNEMLGRPAPSINDRLRTEQAEVGSVLVDSPVKDLKKAIGINDRFVFLHDLFRGDESMYERSIRTINNFRAYPEAEYWIERELKIKLGWDDHKDAVCYFMQLVRRRFI